MQRQMRSVVLWLVSLLAFLVQAQPPPSLASLQAQLEALKAQLPPTCNGSSFLQRNATGWTCVTPVRQSGNSSGWCRASQDGSQTMTCDASPSLLGSPPDCKPPGGKWLGYNATLGGWICVCNAGWSGTSCNISTGVQEIACSAPPVCISAGWSGLYRFVDGGMVCDCLPSWSGVNCSLLGNSTLPPITPDAWYTFNSFMSSSVGTWQSATGSYNASVSGVWSVANVSGYGATSSVPYVAGSPSSTVTFQPLLNGNFTVCTISRYTGNNLGRIIQGDSSNWLQGHHLGCTYVALYSVAWSSTPGVGTTQECSQQTYGGLNDWVFMCGSNSNIFGHGALLFSFIR